MAKLTGTLKSIVNGSKLPAPTTSEFKTAMGTFYDFLAELLGTDSADKAAARTALGLGNVDNTSDANKPVSTAQAEAIAAVATPDATTAVKGKLRLSTPAERLAGAASGSAMTPEDVAASTIGVHHTIQNLMGSRALSTTYTNSTGRPIFVSVTVTANGPGASTVRMLINGVLYVTGGSSEPGYSQTVAAIIPAGGTYNVGSTATLGTLTAWVEVR